MDEYEVVPIDGEGAEVDDIMPTEDEQEEITISDESYDPEEPVEPSAPEELPDGEVADEPEPDSIGYPPDEDILPTEDGDDEIVLEDAEDGGEQEVEPDVIENIEEIPIIGSAREGDVIPVLMRSGAPLGMSPVGWGDRMQSEVDLASQAATEAKAVAQATGQHFWEDSNGAHVTEITKEDWQAEEAKPNPFADVSDSKPYHNLLMNSLGILLRTALKNLVSITRSAIAFFDGQGNAAANVTASFGKDGFQVGVTGESHMVGDYHSLELVDKEGVGYFHVSDLRDRTGQVEVTETFVGDGTTTQFTISLSPDPSLTTLDVKVDGTSVANAVIRQKVYLTDGPAPDGSEVAITYTTEDSRAKAYTFGIRSDNHPVAPMSYAFGDDVAATMPFAYVEGDGTRAYGYASHAEGSSTVARGGFSHAEGYHTEAGQYAHAEGMACVASGPCSHANGRETVAASNHQTAIGHYNVEDANGNYALIIGNGTSDSARSNALTVGWDGSVDAAGDASIGGAFDLTTDDKHISMHDSRLDASYGGVPSTGANVSRVVRMMDSDGRQVSRLLLRQAADGRRMASFESHGYDSNGNDVWNRLGSIVTANGERTYDVGDPAAFCEVLHVGDRVVKDQSTTVSMAASTWADICSVSLAAGTWVVTATGQFASNATGRRCAVLTTSSGNPSASDRRQQSAETMAVNGDATYLNVASTLVLSATTTLKLMGWQNSGAALNVQGLITAVRIK